MNSENEQTRHALSLLHSGGHGKKANAKRSGGSAVSKKIETKANRVLATGAPVGVDLGGFAGSLEVTGIIRKESSKMLSLEIRTSSGFGNMGPEGGTSRGKVKASNGASLAKKGLRLLDSIDNPSSRD